MFRQLLSLFFFCLYTASAGAQALGNEWIRFNQPYYRIKIASDGIYRIPYEQLQALEPNLGIRAEQVRMYKNGREQALFLYHTKDTLKPGDYIQFYGKKNDGVLDKELYDLTPAVQTNPYYSLFSDTAVYFLTWGDNKSNHQLQKASAVAPTSTVANQYSYTETRSFTDMYINGELQAEYATLSEYTDGEGWLGKLIGLGQNKTESFVTSQKVNGGTAELSIAVMGRSNALSNGSNNHHLRISISTDNTNFSTLIDTQFKGYSFIKKRINILSNQLGGNFTYIQLAVINDLGAVSDFIAPAYIQLTYPHLLSSSNQPIVEIPNLKNEEKSELIIRDFAGTKPLLYDFTNFNYYTGTLVGTAAHFTLIDSGNKALLLIDSATFNSVSLEKVTFQSIDLNNDYDYLIIHPAALTLGAKSYADYRSSTGFKPLPISIEQVYDQFSYGQQHPLSVRHFADFMLKNTKNKPKYLLLMGKGQETSSWRNATKAALRLLPSIGVPSSDHLFTSGLNGSIWEPAIPTGRLAIRSNEEILHYLEKVITYEKSPDSLWRKNLVHLSGGNNKDQNNVFKDIVQQQAAIAKDTALGATVIAYAKNVTAPVSNELKSQIISSIRLGAQLVNYFGHGSPTITEINLGNPEEYRNTGKYPIMILNGCIAGNPNLDTSKGEHFIRYPQAGFVGWLGTTGEGYSGYLAEFTTLFYQQAFQKKYGSSIGELLQSTIKAYQKNNDFLNRSHSRQYLFQGDPALHLYAPKKPDYYFEGKAIVKQDDANKRLILAIPILNKGKVLLDSIKWTIKRTFAGKKIITYPTQKHKAIYNRDTLVVSIPNDAKGLNGFSININAGQELTESDYSNNIFQFDYLVKTDGINLLFPAKDEVIKSLQPVLLVQADDLERNGISYLLEIDTEPEFNSLQKISSGWISGPSLVKWKTPFVLKNNQLYYWRAQTKDNTSNEWVTSRFMVDTLSSSTWMQQGLVQLADAQFSNCLIDSSTQQLDFVNTSLFVDIKTKGDSSTTIIPRELRVNTGLPVYTGKEFPGISLMAFDPISLKRYSYPSQFNALANTPDYSYERYTYSGVFYFNASDPVSNDSLLYYLQSIPNNYYVCAYNGRNLHINQFSEALFQAFESIGAAKIREVKSGEPYLIFGKKGLSKGTALEKTADYTSSIPANKQQLQAESYLTGKWDKGSITSVVIGPAQHWQKVRSRFKKTTGDTVRLSVIGIREDGQDTLLIPNTVVDSIDISQIDAQHIPYLQLKVELSDSQNRNPATFDYWAVHYQPLPEYSLYPSKNSIPNSLEEGDSIRITMPIVRLSGSLPDSLELQSFVINAQEERIRSSTIQTLVFGTKDSLNHSIGISSKGLGGNFQVKTVLKVSDIYAQNNQSSSSIQINKDQIQPQISVLFDGKRIINGDIVAPRPIISINTKDNNTFLALDTSLVAIYLKKETESTYTRLLYQNQGVTVNQSKGNGNNLMIQYHPPTAFSDGKYRLKVSAKDQSSNQPATDYMLDFEVINESSITHFYPYPNPFTTQMRFVFTLTGSSIPDQLKIQILTLSGKVVREIGLAELGAIHIGTNISEFAWDGCDQFGDRLGNGVYFYNVIARLNGQAIKKRNTAADHLFEKDWGKIYLMR